MVKILDQLNKIIDIKLFDWLKEDHYEEFFDPKNDF